MRLIIKNNLILLLIISFIFCACYENPRDNTYDPDNVKTIQAPQNVSATDGTSVFYIEINWSAAAGVGAYEVWRSQSEYGSYELAQSVTYWTFYQDDNVSECVYYYYKVRSVSGVNSSEFSNIDIGWRDEFPGGCTEVVKGGQSDHGLQEK